MLTSIANASATGNLSSSYKYIDGTYVSIECEKKVKDGEDIDLILRILNRTLYLVTIFYEDSDGDWNVGYKFAVLSAMVNKTLTLDSDDLRSGYINYWDIRDKNYDLRVDVKSSASSASVLESLIWSITVEPTTSQTLVVSGIIMGTIVTVIIMLLFSLWIMKMKIMNRRDRGYDRRREF